MELKTNAMKKYKVIIVSVVFLFIPVAAVQAQTTFSPDRPGLGNGSFVAQPGMFYIELGAEYDDLGDISQYNFGQILVRYGVAQNVELRLAVNSFTIQNLPRRNQTGMVDPGLGLKINLYHNPETSLNISGLASVSIPAGYSPFTDNLWKPTLTLLLDYQLSRHWAVNSNLGYSLVPSGEPDVLIFTVTPGFTIAKTNFAGYFGYAAFISSVNSRHYLEAGFTRIIGDSMQVDINGGVNLAGVSFFVGTGLALMF